MNRKSFFDKYVSNCTSAMMPSGFDRVKLIKHEDNILSTDYIWEKMEELNPGKSAVAIDLEHPKLSILFRSLFWKGIMLLSKSVDLGKEGEEISDFEDSEMADYTHEFSTLLKDTSKWKKPY
jgi:hypothetical protein